MTRAATISSQLREVIVNALANAYAPMTSSDIATIATHITTDPQRTVALLDQLYTRQTIRINRVRVSDGHHKWGYYNPDRLDSSGRVHHPLAEKLANAWGARIKGGDEVNTVNPPPEAAPFEPPAPPRDDFAFNPIEFNGELAPSPADPIPESAHITLPVTAKSITLTIAGVAIRIDFA